MLKFITTVFPAVVVSTYPDHVDHSKISFWKDELSHVSTTGYIPISKSSETFYWLFSSNNNPLSVPTIVWLQGQIGVSSLFGAVHEFTPAWLGDFNVLFVDGPVGTGFSITTSEDEYATTSEQIASQLYHFLNLFFDRHADDIGSRIILAGEDYAGHTIPVLAALIVHNQDSYSRFRLVGTAVGNGHTHAPIQVITKAESAAFFGLIDGACITEARKHAWSASVKSVAGDASGSLEERNALEQTILNCSPGIDMSNIGHFTSETKPNDLMVELDNWMNDSSLRKVLGMKSDSPLSAKNQTVFNALKPDIMRVIWQYIPPILEANIPMLWYQGQLDWVDGVFSNEAWINALEWSGAEEYATRSRVSWSGGYKRSFGPLTEAMVLNTGHLAIREKPNEILSLFKATFGQS
jgi:carboxypeptidase C (cathepsin A)